MCITHLSTSRRGPLLLSHKSRSTGAFFQMESIYSNNTFDCLNAAPTIIILRSGINKARSRGYNDNRNDLPIPLLPINMGNLRFHTSCKINACMGDNCMLSTYLHTNEKYSGRIISQAIRSSSWSLSLLWKTKSIGLNKSSSLTSMPSQASSKCLSFIIMYLLLFEDYHNP